MPKHQLLPVAGALTPLGRSLRVSVAHEAGMLRIKTPGIQLGLSRDEAVGLVVALRAAVREIDQYRKEEGGH